MSQDSQEAIPQPRPRPIVGNIPDIDADTPIQSLAALQKTYGPIFRFQRPGGNIVIVSSQKLVSELADERYFGKVVQGALENIRDFAGDGLFTAHSDEPNWAVAHRVLVPAFGPAALRDMYPQMVDIADQMLTKWERLGPKVPLDLVDNMTRLTLDTIALCGFDYRFNSFYERDAHPFIGAMVGALAEAGARVRRMPLQTRLMLMTERQYADDVKFMHEIADMLIRERRQDPDGGQKRDLLARMLTGKDPVTGKTLGDVNIRYQMVTFLIAGHETTSGLLSFAVHFLLKHPHILERARAEADAVLSNEAPRPEHASKLRFIDQILRETLRLWPTAPAFAVAAKEDRVLGGKYPIQKGQINVVLALALHRDPEVWHDPEKFDPDRWEPERAKLIPEHAWKPFGNGARACIGRPFAMQEAALVLALLLHRFDIVENDPTYQLKVKETLTLKPEGIFIRAKRRSPASFRGKATPTSAAVATPAAVTLASSGPTTHGTNTVPILVLYGSNSGSSEAFAQRVAGDAGVLGYPVKCGSLDDFVDQLPKGGVIIIVTASYEGHPPDNARNFVAWLEQTSTGALAGVRFAVFGCGNRDWARTYQAIPKKIDTLLAASGAERAFGRGEADASDDFFGAFEAWYGKLWASIGGVLGHKVEALAAKPLFEVEIVTEGQQSLAAQNGLNVGTIVANRQLVDLRAKIGRSKRHIEIALPEGQTYRAGDYIAILPENPRSSVDRVLKHFGFNWETKLVLRYKREGGASFLPTGRPVTAAEVLTRYVELAQPATQKQVRLLAETSPCPPEKRELQRYGETAEAYKTDIFDKRVSLIDLLERFASCNLPFALYLEALSPLKPRQYSISSSPLWNSEHCTVTLAAADGPAWSGQGVFQGVSSTFLARAEVGAQVAVSTRPAKSAFHLPEALATPVIMVGAGSGIAPFRGFIQERALRAARGETPGKALLYFGCEHPDVDYLYRDELAAWESEGVVSVRPCFNKLPDGDVQFVQHRLWKEQGEIFAMLRDGAHVYVCGDGRYMAPAVRDTFVRIYQANNQTSAEVAALWLESLEEGIRYVADVFG